MQIEKHSEKNLFCYITEEDLRELDISFDSLAYGTNAFRRLLAAIMKKASENNLFSSYELPLMAEAVPLNNRELFVQLCAIEEAEELDPRFAQFSPSIFDELDLEDEDHSEEDMEHPEGIYITEDDHGEKPSFSSEKDIASFKNRRSAPQNSRRSVYVFDTYDALITALRSAGTAKQFSQVRSALYYHPEKKQYYLVLFQYQNSAPIRALLHSVCEYASVRPLTSSVQAWLAEHCRCLIRAHAISRLLEAVSGI